VRTDSHTHMHLPPCACVKSFKMRKKSKNPEMSDPGKNWNVVTGCDKYSDGCLNCYAEDTVVWLQGLGQEKYVQNGFNVTLHEDKLDWPLIYLPKKPQRPARSFVTDMGDLFHEKVPDDRCPSTGFTFLQRGPNAWERLD